MALKQQLMDDMKAAMRAGDHSRRDALRLLLAAIKQVEVDRQTALDDQGVQAVLAHQAKQRRESIADYGRAGRREMVAAEEAELAVIEQYLPRMMSRAEIAAAAQQVIAELNVTDMKGMGQVMGRLLSQLQGRADGRVASEVVRELLRS